MIRVVVADDMALVRGGMKMILEADPGIRVVGEAADGAEAVEEAIRTSPDVAVMDIRMPGVDGIEATRRLQQRMPGVRVLVVTTFHLDEYVHEALRAGAAGFLLKDAPPQQLIDAIRSVGAGHGLIAPEVTRRLIARFAAVSPAVERAHELDELSPREHEVLLQIARGRSNAEIAAALVVEESTVKSHVSRLLAKLGCSSRVQAVILAYEAGLVTPGGGVPPS